MSISRRTPRWLKVTNRDRVAHLFLTVTNTGPGIVDWHRCHLSACGRVELYERDGAHPTGRMRGGFPIYSPDDPMVKPDANTPACAKCRAFLVRMQRAKLPPAIHPAPRPRRSASR
jgi:hypothetical protein